MKRGNLVLVMFLTLSGIFSVLDAQTACKVLKTEISWSYTGECRKGLAEGSGEATGVDFYKGDFVKGLPEGKGIYIWENGDIYEGDWKKGMKHGYGIYTFTNNNRDSVLAGEWKRDVYMGNPVMQHYVIEYRNSIGRVSFVKVGDRPYVRYKFSRNGIESLNINNLFMQGSSGAESTTASFTGFEEVKFPFKGKVMFNAPNSFQSATLTCELRFIINEPGSWIVTMFY